MTGVPPAYRVHTPTVEDGRWRESFYLNLGDPRSGIGVWIYVWTFPNRGRSHAQVVLYKGLWPKPVLTETLSARSEPTLLRRGDDWLYAFHQAVEDPLGDVEHLRAGGLTIGVSADAGTVRYAVDLDDGAGGRLHASFRTFSPLWLYSGTSHGCPQWLASDRYHQAVRGEVQLELPDLSVSLSGTGESDHSWGVRDHVRMASVEWDYWAWCTPDGSDQLSLFRFREPEVTLLGHHTVAGTSAAVVAVEEQMRFGERGESLGGRLRLTDELGRVRVADVEPSYAAVGYGNPVKRWSEGYEAVATLLVDGVRLDGLHAHTRPPA